jgi:hypothetical protein
MPCEGFEPMTPVFEWGKAVYASLHAITLVRHQYIIKSQNLASRALSLQ